MPDRLPNPEWPVADDTSNRTFRLAAGILGGIVLLSLACLAGYGLLVAPSQREAVRGAIAVQVEKVPRVAQAITAAAAVLGWPTSPGAATPTSTPFVVEPTVAGAAAPAIPAGATLIAPTRTPLLVQPTATNGNMADPATATVAAALTRASGIQPTGEPTPTALPATGIANESSALGQVVAAFALVAVIMMARWLRTARGKTSGRP